MTDADYENLRFLLTSPPEVLADWYDQVSEDDLVYATALLEIAELELIDEITARMDLFPSVLGIVEYLKVDRSN